MPWRDRHRRADAAALRPRRGRAPGRRLPRGAGRPADGLGRRPTRSPFRTPRSRMIVHSSQELSPLTFGNEDRLPRVPLPTLEESCGRFLEWCGPLLTADERAAAETAVASFLRPDGPARQLHAALEQYDAADGVHSWLDAFWPYRYLGRRDRIALHANFFFLFEDSGQGQVERAAGLVAAAVDYKLLIDEQLLPPAVQRGWPLSMEQNKYLFSATRIPGPVQDGVRTPYSEDWPGPSRERHIVVFVRGNMFRLDVIGSKGRPDTLDEIAAGLDAVMEAGATPAARGTAVGHLTTKARAASGASRQALRDFGDGTAGLNGEHCKLDGTTLVSFVDAVLGSSAEEHSRRSGAESQGTPTCAPLDFVLDADLQADVQAAAAAFAAYAADTASSILAIEGFSSERAKQLRMSPDAFAQMAFQLAHQRAKGHVGATYESIATRHYRHGRTEAMRVVTPEVVRFVTDRK